MTGTPAFASPCVDICVIDGDTDWCIGCGRTLDEIADWGTKPVNERRRIIGELPARMAILDQQSR